MNRAMVWLVAVTVIVVAITVVIAVTAMFVATIVVAATISAAIAIVVSNDNVAVIADIALTSFYDAIAVICSRKYVRFFKITH